MRRLIIAMVALFAIIAFAPSSQASPLIPAGGLAAAAAQNDVVQVNWHGRWHHHWRHHRHWGWHHHHHWGWGWHHHHHWGWRHHHHHRGW
jgi:hypothetical protein